MVLFTLISFAIVGCATPKPAPAWPTGKERPINKTPAPLKSSEVQK